MAPADRTRGGEAANVILKGTRLEGDLHFSSQLVVGGQLKGNIRCDSTLVIERGGRVEGRVEAQTIVVQGELEGTVLASQSLEICLALWWPACGSPRRPCRRRRHADSKPDDFRKPARSPRPACCCTSPCAGHGPCHNARFR